MPYEKFTRIGYTRQYILQDLYLVLDQTQADYLTSCTVLSCAPLRQTLYESNET